MTTDQDLKNAAIKDFDNCSSIYAVDQLEDRQLRGVRKRKNLLPAERYNRIILMIYEVAAARRKEIDDQEVA